MPEKKPEAKKGFLAKLAELLKPIGAGDKKKRAKLGKNAEKLLKDVDS